MLEIKDTISFSLHILEWENRDEWNAMEKRKQSSYLHDSNKAKKSELAFKGWEGICQRKRGRSLYTRGASVCKETQ